MRREKSPAEDLGGRSAGREPQSSRPGQKLDCDGEATANLNL